jgi:hypothetical protein
VAPGTYYIGGYMYDGAGTYTTSHLAQAITISADMVMSPGVVASARIAATSAVFASVGEALDSSVSSSTKVDWLNDV